MKNDVGRIILSDDDPEFVLYRISQRLGLPVHPSWASWFWSVLQQKQRIQPLDGLGYRPIAVVGSKEEFLEWIGEAVKEKTIEIPDDARLDSAGGPSARHGSADGFVLQPQQLAYAVSSQHLHRALHRTGLSPLFHTL